MLKKVFKISSTLYPTPIVIQAIESFSDFQIQLIDSSIIIEDDDPQFVFDEFMNYTLSLLLE